MIDLNRLTVLEHLISVVERGLKMAKNLMGKTRKEDNPYMIFKAGDWEWRVLKAYKSAEAEAKDPYARWFLAVKSPNTHGSFELGDGYVKDVVGAAALVYASPEAVESYPAAVKLWKPRTEL